MQEFDKNQLPQEPPKPVAKEEKPNSAPATESFLCKPPVRTAISASFGGLVGAGTSYTGPAALGLGAAAATMLSVVLQTNCKSELDWGETAI